jgi:glycosyltransferase involved in cell wall biosynthesis
MKILYHHRLGSRDGQAVHMEELIAALRRAGHEVLVVGPPLNEAQSFGGINPWVNRLRALLPKPLYELAELGYALAIYRRLARQIRAYRPDVIYERYNLYQPAGIWASRRYRLPLLLEVNAPLAQERREHGGLAFPRLAQRLEAYTWRKASGVLPVTRVLAGHVERSGVPGTRIEVIPNGIDPARFDHVPDTIEAKRSFGLEEKLVLGFVGFVREWHGIDRVLDWMAAPASTPAAHLLVVGDGPGRPALEAQARTLAIQDRVTFTGVMERERVPEAVAAFDIALQPAVVPYASPLKLFEYLALGRAVVAPSQANLREVLEHEVNAELFDPAEPRALELALDRLAADEGLRSRLGAGARETVTRMGMTWDANASRVARRFAALLEGRTGA